MVLVILISTKSQNLYFSNLMEYVVVLPSSLFTSKLSFLNKFAVFWLDRLLKLAPLPWNSSMVLVAVSSVVVFGADLDLGTRSSLVLENISVADEGNLDRGQICDSFSFSWKSDFLVENTGSLSLARLSDGLILDRVIFNNNSARNSSLTFFSLSFSVPCLRKDSA